jgi:hypothetical protein
LSDGAELGLASHLRRQSGILAPLATERAASTDEAQAVPEVRKTQILRKVLIFWFYA